MHRPDSPGSKKRLPGKEAVFCCLWCIVIEEGLTIPAGLDPGTGLLQRFQVFVTAAGVAVTFFGYGFIIPERAGGVVNSLDGIFKIYFK